ncbi:MAG: DEAD/DEAH box helicase [Candidatus Liptonbacteria bacterium]|nr:DEAD/DEAH box helicase [Candidatus Liptonbacteria bacterium]
MIEQSGFRGLGIAPSILTILDRLAFTAPTPIQQKSIPQAIEGKDMVGIAQTGTGKTLAFGIPLIQTILKDGRARALVVLPTRELAVQVDESLRKIGNPLGIKTAVLIGGEAISRQLYALRRTPQVILATPGRLIDHLMQKTVNLKDVKVVVLDEADRMLDMGFAPQLKRILTVLPTERQTMLFSATMPESIVSMARAYMKLPVRVEIARSGTAAQDVTHELFFVTQPEKPRLLEKVLQEYRGSVLVFSRTKFGAKKIAAHLRALGHTAVDFHSNRSLSQRRDALEGFKNGKYRVVVATDIAARGIDVKNIELVLNYDLPTVAEDYIHRIGRTGRAGGKGHAISFARPDQRRDVQAIERLMRAALPVSRLPALPPSSAPLVFEREAAPYGHRPHSRPGSRFGRTPYPRNNASRRFRG